jgi:hypothetical protein
MNTKYQEDSIITTNVYQYGPENNQMHFNVMSFIGYIYHSWYTELYFAHAYCRKNHWYYCWLALFVFYMKVVKQYVSFISLHIHLPET